MKIFKRGGDAAAPKERSSTKRQFNKALRVGAIVLVAALLFGSGWAAGSGHLGFNGLKVEGVNKSLPKQLDYSSVNDIYNLLQQNFDGKLDTATLTDGLKEGLAKATGDPYTEYFNPKDAKDFTSQLNGTFEGIGAELGKDDQKNIIVIAPLDGFPAAKAGLKPKDIIAQVDGKSVYDLTINDAVSKIRGPAGTKVQLTVIRGTQTIKLDIVREAINIPSVKSSITDGIGYMKVSQFSTDTADLAQKAAAEFKQANVRGVILDLRGDPGGYLDKAVAVSSLWLPRGATVLTERRENVTMNTYNSTGNNILAGIPTVVLIDDGSASASEITAGALHDNKVAQLVGIKSFGKGSVQQPENLPNGGLIKITIARWFTPDGKNIDKEGITPDVEVKISDDQAKAGQDPQKDKATELLQQAHQ